MCHFVSKFKDKDTDNLYVVVEGITEDHPVHVTALQDSVNGFEARASTSKGTVRLLHLIYLHLKFDRYCTIVEKASHLLEKIQAEYPEYRRNDKHQAEANDIFDIFAELKPQFADTITLTYTTFEPTNKTNADSEWYPLFESILRERLQHKSVR
ncbi:hypothetical protein GQ43DRAFT_434706 [Delitschia confertaspora ATCC 74209]|uniref:Uncharacterized protein n=1 Tax=Delitschia confertaspora ATCC 74209 TaxID=1513339 RepID=A0A9P4MVF2_9PLEO|nr:hypothetical protein GQ43DRAFT_434706 [Delitschia confertaspora ATCC 74209]